MLEARTHPRFAIGESTIPETTALMGILADRYDVPELDHLGNFQKVRRHVGSSCGVKRSFSFAHHRPGEDQRPKEVTQFSTWAPPFGPDIHLFRQDVDAYLLHVAIQYGTVVRQNTKVHSMDLSDEGWIIQTGNKKTFSASYIVDAAGYRSPLSQKYGLREADCSFSTHSRTLFTHMIGVRPYDEICPRKTGHGMPSPFCQGTLHHIFPGGWLWVIPFDNHETSTNPLCSVGLSLDMKRYPKTDQSPEDEFWHFIAKFPSISEQFEPARAVRDWTGTGRLQYCSSTIVGDRFCLMPHSAGFVDALFSSGLSMTMLCINSLAQRLIDATKDADFSTERFEYIEKWTRVNLKHYDELVKYSYLSFDDFDLWNAWHRFWLLGSLLGPAGLFGVHGNYMKSRNPDVLKAFEKAPYRALQAIDLNAYAKLFASAVDIMQSFEKKSLLKDEAVQQLYALLEKSPLCPPLWKMTDANRRYPSTLTFWPMLRMILWAKYRSGPIVRKHYFNSGNSAGYFSQLWNSFWTQARQSFRVYFGLAGDHFFSWNNGWRKTNKLTPGHSDHFNDQLNNSSIEESELEKQTVE